LINASTPKQQLEPTLDSISPVLESVSKVLADSGYYNEKAVTKVESAGNGPKVSAAIKRHGHGRSIEQLEKREDPAAPPPGAPVSEVMAHRLETKDGKDIYGKRKQTVEPVFGIIKEALGFRRFRLRGIEKVNLKRLFDLGMRLKGV
jgi:hypothetical protein